MRHRSRSSGGLLVALALVLGLGGGTASAQTRGRPGDFDFWVLSLSWSPSWCEAVGNEHRDVQCSRPYGFVVHGLWPQYERGFPENCPTSATPPSSATIDAMLELMPSPGLIQHEWKAHGTCSGLTADSYFRAIRSVAARIAIPSDERLPERPRMIAPSEIERDFIAANRGLTPDAVAVVCDGRRLREVRLCLSRDLSGFRRCPEVDRRDCRLDRAFMPAVRSGQ